ncbi:MAG: hypothetical protein JNK05_26085 [Myxococcales bacterium]|nr:hypothetical protein [Myxococcales bacterium]
MNALRAVSTTAVFVASMLAGASAMAQPDASVTRGPSPAARVVEQVVDVELGGESSCVRTSAGRVFCWGRGLGISSSSHRISGADPIGAPSPELVSDVSNARAIAVGNFHLCAIDGAGVLNCGGDNRHGQLGSGSAQEHSYRRVSLPGSARAVAVGAAHSCAIVEGRGVFCWGMNAHGEVDGRPGVEARSPVAVRDTADVVELALGAYFSCARRANGTVLCWGENEAEQLGRSGTSHAVAPIVGLTNVRSLHAGYSHACAVMADRTARCWGLNAWGALGAVAARSIAEPRAMDAMPPVRSLALGYGFTCALTDEAPARVQCVGHADHGKCGRDPTHASNPQPTTIALSDEPTALDASGDHACALLRNGTVECWGNGAHGELGDGRVRRGETLSQVVGLTNATRIAAYGGNTCAVSGDSLYCWGSGQRGIFSVRADGTAPRPVAFSARVRGGVFSLGGAHACVCPPRAPCSCAGEGLLRDAGGYVLGAITGPMWGLGAAWRSATVVSVASLWDVTCAARVAGGRPLLACFGRDEANLIPGTRLPTERNVAREVPLPQRGRVQLFAGPRHLCSLDGRGTLVCFGSNAQEQLRDAPTTVSAVTEVFRRVRAPRSARRPGPLVALGDGRTCAIFDGVLRCRGTGGGSAGVWAEADVGGDAEAIYGGLGGFCVRIINGRYSCWGDGRAQHFGPGLPLANVAFGGWVQPHDAPAFVGAVELAIGSEHTCGRWPDGSVRCIGSNELSQLGDGTTSWSARPVRATLEL